MSNQGNHIEPYWYVVWPIFNTGPVGPADANIQNGAHGKPNCPIGVGLDESCAECLAVFLHRVVMQMGFIGHPNH